MKLFLNPEQLHTLCCMWRHPQASRSDLIAFQNRKLRHLVAHAYANVIHYRELFDRAGLRPNDIASVADLERIPPTSKDDLRERPVEETLASGTAVRQLVTRMTSGSSGKPFTIRRTPWEEHLINMFRIRAWHQVGMKSSDHIARIIEPRLGGETRGFVGQVRQAMGIFRNHDIDCFQPADAINRALERLRPDVVHGFPSTLAYTAASRKGSAVFPGSPRIITTGGEVLSPPVRAAIERGFSAPVYDLYGAHEFNLLAWECPQGGAYHVCEDSVILEIVGHEAAAAVDTGEIVVTALHAYAMPFIRYRIGDIATRGAAHCPCAQPFSTLSGIQGRTVEMFRLPGNRLLHPFEITGPLIELHREWIFQHQMIQESQEKVKLKIIPRRRPSADEMTRLQDLGGQKLGPETVFTVELVERFALPPGRKFSPYVSMLVQPSETLRHDAC